MVHQICNKLDHKPRLTDLARAFCIAPSPIQLPDESDIILEFMRSSLGLFSAEMVSQRDSMEASNPHQNLAHLPLTPLNPFAITGADSLYFAIEHSMLDTGSISGVRKRCGEFRNRRDLDSNGALLRLDAFNAIGEVACFTTWRNSFSPATMTELCKQFDERYGQYFAGVLYQFQPFAIHADACVRLALTINRASVRSLGRGVFTMDRTKDGSSVPEYKAVSLEDDVENPSNTFSLQVIIDDSTHALIFDSEDIETLYIERAAMIYTIAQCGAICDCEENVRYSVVRIVNTLYRDIFSSTAFQAALCCSFFREIENAVGLHAVFSFDLRQVFDEYIDQLNAYFVPKQPSQLKRLFRTFGVHVSGECPAKWSFSESRDSFQNVVFAGQMTPDQWPAYRAILLEIWRPSIDILKHSVSRERDICRKQVFGSLIETFKLRYCTLNGVSETQLADEQKESIFDSARTVYFDFLSNLGADATPSIEALRQMLNGDNDFATQCTLQQSGH